MKKLILLIVCFFTIGFTSGQSAALSRKVTLDVRNIPLENVLEEIEHQLNVRFSYNSGLINVGKKVSYSTTENSLENVLFDLFGEEVRPKLRGNYIILQKRNPPKKKDFYVFGYIKDGNTGQEIENVSIYEPVSLASALSNTHGYYKIKLSKGLDDIDLHFSKENYDLRIANIYGREDQSLPVTLVHSIAEKQLTADLKEIQTKDIKPGLTQPESIQRSLENSRPTEVPVPAQEAPERITLPELDLSDEVSFIDSTIKSRKEQFMQWLMTTRQNRHARNIRDSLYKPFQVSFLPFIGTNLALSPIVTNDYSFNIVAGYTGNVRKFEMGSAVNIVRYTMSGLQLSGGINVVGREMTGVQMAGGANFNLRNSQGLVMAGGANFTLADAKGLAMAGGFNSTFGRHEGLQIAPVNFAGSLAGSQIGVVNVARKVEKGVPVGFISFAGINGYRRLEVNTSELNVGELSFKTGVPAFYNIFSAAYSFNRDNKPLFGFGYGLGTAWKYNRWLGSDIDLLVTTYLPDSPGISDYVYWSQHARLSLSLEAKLGRRFAVFVAPTANLFISESGDLNFSKYPLLIAERNANWLGDEAKSYSWIGYKAGIRLCSLR